MLPVIWKDMTKISPLYYFHGTAVALRSPALCCSFWIGHSNYAFVQAEVSLYLTNYLKSFILLQPAGSVLVNLLTTKKGQRYFSSTFRHSYDRLLPTLYVFKLYLILIAYTRKLRWVLQSYFKVAIKAFAPQPDALQIFLLQQKQYKAGTWESLSPAGLDTIDAGLPHLFENTDVVSVSKVLAYKYLHFGSSVKAEVQSKTRFFSI